MKKSGVVGIILIIFFNLACRDNLDQEMVAFYPFNGNAADASGNGPDGRAENVVACRDRFDREDSAYYFDGKTASILVEVSQMPVLESPQSFSWWFYLDTIPAFSDEFGAGNILALVDTGTGIGIQIGFRAPAYGTLGLDTWKWGGGTLLECPPPSIHTWHHGVYTYDGSTHRFYIDARETARSILPPQSGKPSLLMFGNYPTGDQYFRGKLDDIRIYQRKLSLSEINSLYKMAPRVRQR